MSFKKDETGQFVTKEEFQRLQEQVKTLTSKPSTMNGSPKTPTSPPPTLPKTAPPPLPGRDTGSGRSGKPMKKETEILMRSAREPPRSVKPVQKSCNKPGCDNGCSHSYEEIVMTSAGDGVDDNLYEQLDAKAGSEAYLLHRLQKLENNQQAIMSKQDSITNDMREIKALLAEIKKTSDDAYFKVMENSDTLGQQLLHVRRDIQSSITGEPITFGPADYAQKLKNQKRYFHEFEWQVQNTDFMIEKGRVMKSQSFYISHINFKIIAEAKCNKEGRMYLRIEGDFTHMDPNEIGPRCARFACTVKAIDRTGQIEDYVLGKVAGDFHTNKQYMIGDVLLIDLKRKGLCPCGNVQLKFEIEVYA